MRCRRGLIHSRAKREMFGLCSAVLLFVGRLFYCGLARAVIIENLSLEKYFIFEYICCSCCCSTSFSSCSLCCLLFVVFTN